MDRSCTTAGHDHDVSHIQPTRGEDFTDPIGYERTDCRQHRLGRAKDIHAKWFGNGAADRLRSEACVELDLTT
jgi:hypothetical protein